MKKNNNSRFIAVFTMIISGFLLAYNLLQEIHVVITYISIFFLGVSTASLYIIQVGNKRFKKMHWLESRLSLWNAISFRVKKAGEASFNEMPIGIIVFNEQRVIQWANNYAKDIFLSPLVERNIELISKDLYYSLNEKKFQVTIYGRIFDCEVLEEHNVLYMVDKTNMIQLEKKYKNRTLAMGIINLDNLDQALTDLDAQDRSRQISNLIGLLGDWCDKSEIYLKGYSETQYLILMTYEQLHEAMQEGFKIVDTIKLYCLKENIRSGASIGIACSDIQYDALFELAVKQLELALNRGGSQTVVNIDGHVTYYGGNTHGVENRSPVYVRGKTEELRQLASKVGMIYVMPHADMDADAFGSALAMVKLMSAFKKTAKLVFDPKNVDRTIEYLYKSIQTEHVATLEYLIDPRDAINEITKDDLVVIIDTQHASFLQDDKLYKKANHVAILDHHRRSTAAITKYDYLYVQPSASSSVELVVEMYEFLDAEVEMTSQEATWMLMGVIVDTNNLLYRTSYRTFNVLSTLQRYGAEMQQAYKHLREEFEEYIKRVNILNTAEIIDGKFGIAICKDDVNQRQFLAKIADNIISVRNIKAAFAIGYLSDDEIGISARSIDDVNVQLIMEYLGGGGHYNNAACQIRNSTIEEVKAKLIDELKKVNDGGLNLVKIILTANVKGKGKIGEIIEIPAGHANFLIRSNQAIIATVENVKQLENQKQQEKIDAEKLLQEMRELKTVIEAKPVTISAKVGKEGKMFGSVSTKQIVDEYKTQHNITLDKRKIMHEGTFDALGTYQIPISLHKDVLAKIILHVVEKE